MPLTLRTLKKTVFKQRPLQSSDLEEAEKYTVEANQEFKIDTFAAERRHLRFALSDGPLKGLDTWYGFEEHIEITGNTTGLNSLLYPKPRPRAIKLEVPYLSQLDNFENPTGACNVTSLAMCLKYFRIPQRTQAAQFEDELYRYAIGKGYSRHSPYDLAKIVKDYGGQDDFRVNATISQVQDWLSDRKPVVVHGYFTSFGHIVVLVGYDETGFFVHDPYGEWFSTGYRTDLPGAYLKYSYKLIQDRCIPDGDFWVHFMGA
ncbi:MAG: peptidoglycan-binding protein [Oscillatoriales cyanobacterium]|nr:MAG: peptidoglycan-binding protein [Oscillatoriales cyanobacterium]